MRCVHFIQEFVKHPGQVGTFTQSSKYLAKKIAEQIDGSLEVVEFGPGTGPITKEILKKLPENGRLLCFEVNSKFCEYLERINDPRLEVINDDAKNCVEYVDDLECVVSGLPLTLFGKSKKKKILDVISKSRIFIQLQYSPFMAKRMKDYFSDVRVKFVPLNFPPAFIYVCKSSIG